MTHIHHILSPSLQRQGLATRPRLFDLQRQTKNTWHTRGNKTQRVSMALGYPWTLLQSNCSFPWLQHVTACLHHGYYSCWSSVDSSSKINQPFFVSMEVSLTRRQPAPSRAPTWPQIPHLKGSENGGYSIWNHFDRDHDDQPLDFGV